MDPDSREWVTGLTADQPGREVAISRLHSILVRIAHGEALRRAGMNGIEGKELEDLADQAAADALISILRKVEEFRGESRFTTWAYKFVIYEISGKFGRHVWRRDGVQLDDEAWDQLPERLGSSPTDHMESQQLVDAVHEGVEKVLTPHQRQVFAAVVLNGTPLDALVVELGTNRNALYKTIFDARRKLRDFLITHGYLNGTR